MFKIKNKKLFVKQISTEEENFTMNNNINLIEKENSSKFSNETSLNEISSSLAEIKTNSTPIFSQNLTKQLPKQIKTLTNSNEFIKNDLLAKKSLSKHYLSASYADYYDIHENSNSKKLAIKVFLTEQNKYDEKESLLSEYCQKFKEQQEDKKLISFKKIFPTEINLKMNSGKDKENDIKENIPEDDIFIKLEPKDDIFIEREPKDDNNIQLNLDCNKNHSLSENIQNKFFSDDTKILNEQLTFGTSQIQRLFNDELIQDTPIFMVENENSQIRVCTSQGDNLIKFPDSPQKNHIVKLTSNDSLGIKNTDEINKLSSVKTNNIFEIGQIIKESSHFEINNQNLINYNDEDLKQNKELNPLKSPLNLFKGDKVDNNIKPTTIKGEDIRTSNHKLSQKTSFNENFRNDLKKIENLNDSQYILSDNQIKIRNDHKEFENFKKQIQKSSDIIGNADNHELKKNVSIQNIDNLIYKKNLYSIKKSGIEIMKTNIQSKNSNNIDEKNFEKDINSPKYPKVFSSILFKKDKTINDIVGELEEIKNETEEISELSYEKSNPIDSIQVISCNKDELNRLGELLKIEKKGSTENQSDEMISLSHPKIINGEHSELVNSINETLKSMKILPKQKSKNSRSKSTSKPKNINKSHTLNENNDLELININKSSKIISQTSLNHIDIQIVNSPENLQNNSECSKNKKVPIKRGRKSKKRLISFPSTITLNADNIPKNQSKKTKINNSSNIHSPQVEKELLDLLDKFIESKILME